MAHLHRKEIFQDRLPYSTVIDLLIDLKGVGSF